MGNHPQHTTCTKDIFQPQLIIFEFSNNVLYSFLLHWQLHKAYLSILVFFNQLKKGEEKYFYTPRNKILLNNRYSVALQTLANICYLFCPIIVWNTCFINLFITIYIRSNTFLDDHINLKSIPLQSNISIIF